MKSKVTLPLPIAGETWPTFFSAEYGRAVVGRINALSNISIVRGGADEARLSDSNLILTIKDDSSEETTTAASSVSVYKISSIANVASDYIAAQPVTFDNANAETLGSAVSVALPWQLRAARAGTVSPAYAVNEYMVVASSDTGVGVSVSSVQLTLVDLGIGRTKGIPGCYRGVYSSGTAYAVNDLVHTIAGSNLVTLLWACTTAGTGNTPTAGSTTNWRLVGLSGNYRRFTVNSGQTNNDYLICDEASSAASNVNIYKPYKLRGSITTETLAGDTVTYGTYGTDKMSRTATISSVDEKQVIIPYILSGDSIYAEYDVIGDKWVDVNIDGRAWARKWDQS